MSNRKRESGIYIVQDIYKEDPLHPCVCPNCANCSLDREPIISYDNNKQMELRTSPENPYIVKEYEWIPHKCTACGTRFIAWESKEYTNEDMVWASIVVIIGVLLTVGLIVLGIITTPAWLFGLIVSLVLIFCGLTGLSESKYSKDCGIESVNDLVCFPEEDEEEETRSVESIAVRLLKKEDKQPDFPVVETIRQARERKEQHNTELVNGGLMVADE